MSRRRTKFIKAVSTAALFLVLACASREQVLPRPAPMAVHEAGALSAKEQKRLGDIRRFLSPHEQRLVEKSLEELARDPRLPDGVGDEAVRQAIAGSEEAEEFCPRLAAALRPHMLIGPPAQAPLRIAFAVPIERAHRDWMVSSARERFPAPLDLAKAVRDGQVGPEIFEATQIFDREGSPALVTDAAEFDKKGPSAGGRLCLTNPPTHSYVIAIVATEALPELLHVPTAADGVCRERFVLPEVNASAGVTCTGRPEYATQAIPLSLVQEIRLSR